MVRATDRCRIERFEDALRVVWPAGGASVLPYLWLRHNCGCDSCIVAQTGERRFLLHEAPADIQPAAFDFDGERLSLTWPDGHRTQYCRTDITALSVSRHADPRLWAADFRPGRWPLDAFLDDDAAAANALTSFVCDGAIVLTDASNQPATLERLAKRLGPIREVLFARIHDVTVNPAGYNVAHTSLGLPPHNDFASYSWPPSVQALHMLVNDAGGGESIVVDGFAVLAGLRAEHPAYFEVLASMPVPFREFDEHTETFAVEPIVRLDTAGEVVSFRFSNQLMQTIDPAHPQTAEFYRAYRELGRRICDDAAKSVFRLNGAEILVVAAHRVLHARQAFEPTGPRHLQDAYFEFDNAANHLVVLRRKGYGNG